MSENTKIEWADHTFNPWTGCTKVSPGCDHCYAESWAKRSGTVRWGVGEPRRRTTEANWRLPRKWNAQAEREGRRFRVFCSSLADVFDNAVPPEWRSDLFEMINATPHLDWLLLTKRVGNVPNMLPVPFDFDKLYPHVIVGSTIDHDKDHKRLRLQHAAVFNVMKDGHWRPLALIARLTGAPEASVSASLRDFRKERFGGHTVQRERRDWDGGTWVYRLIVRVAA